MNRRTTLLALSAAAILGFFAALQSVAPPDGFFSGDQGAKYLQTRAFALQGPLRPGIEVASRDVDPELRHQILVNRGGRLVGVFAWLLPLLTAPFFAAFGFRGLYVIPALSVVALFLAAAAFGRRLTGGDGLLTAWTVVLAAPVPVYGGELWEHAPAAACVMGAALLLAPREEVRAAGGWRPALAAGALVGVAALFREEAFFALPALVAGRAIAAPPGTRVREAIATGTLAGAGALAVFLLAIPMNLVVYRSAMPLHLSSELAKSNAHPPVRSELAARLLLPVRSAWVYVVCAVLGVFAAWRHKGRDAVDAWLAVTIGCVLVLLTIAVLVPLWRTVVFGEPRYRAYSVDSIAHTWPFCIALVLLPLASPDVGRDRLARYLCLAAALMIIGALAIVPTAGGAQWSPRYLFAAAPLLAVVASAPAHRAFRGPAALVLWTARAVLLCSAVAQVDGLRLLIDAKSRNARITHRLANLTRPGDVVISDAYWFLQVTAELIPSRRMLLAWSPDDVGQVAALAARRGIRDVAVASSSAETGYRAPRSLDASAEGCVFTRNVRLSLGERGLIVHRYSCGPGAVVK